uniref:PKD/REJ-like domain-containing protein n=2 Tax=Cryptomonas curvata TaxID=233186 RepID=A0A7S0LXR5_9CRYP|mmetsp:Transcript_15339/g.32781  ORF Transcript_15339/g.32781 Transcript_15339/m.32781 type:complete len:1748 (+) Transcript_15339:2-5245(+)
MVGKEYQCSDFFEIVVIRALGEDCVARLKDRRTMLISLGLYSTFGPDTKLIFKHNLMKHGKNEMDFTAPVANGHFVKIQGRPSAPSVMFRAPRIVSDCNDLLVRIWHPSGIATRKLRYEWNVTFKDGNGLNLIHNSFLNLDYFKIETSLLHSGNTYLVTARATDGFGQSSYMAKEIIKVDRARPQISILGLNSIYIRIQDTILLHADTTQSNCGPFLSLQFEWSIRSEESGISPTLFIPSNSSRFLLQPHKLLWGSVYIVKAKVYPMSEPEAFGETEVSFRSCPHKLDVSIIGGSRIVSVFDDIELQVLINGPTTSSKVISWLCWPSPCFEVCPDLLGVAQEQLVLPKGAVRPGQYKFTVRVTSSHGPNMVERKDEVWLFVVPARVADVKVLRTHSKRISPTFRLSALFRESDSFQHMSWAQASGAEKIHFPEKLLLKYHVLPHSELVIPALVNGGQYRFRFLLSTCSELGFSEVSIVLPDPPVGGVFSVSPTTGFAVDTEFNLEMYGWIDDMENLPLRFVLSYLADKDSGLENEVPTGTVLEFHQQLRIPCTSKTSQISIFFLKAQNAAGVSACRNLSVAAFAPPNPGASALAIESEIEGFTVHHDPSKVFRLVVVLNSLLVTSATSIRRAAFGNNAGICKDDGTSCDNDGLRMRTLLKIKKILQEVREFSCDEVELAALAIGSAVSTHVNASTRILVLACVHELLDKMEMLVLPESVCSMEFTAETLLLTISKVMQAADASKRFAPKTEDVHHADVLVLQMVDIVMRGLQHEDYGFLISSPRIQIVAARLTKGQPADLMLPGEFADHAAQVTFPATIFANGVALDAALVHLRSSSSSVSKQILDTGGYILHLTLKFANGSQRLITSVNDAILLKIPQTAVTQRQNGFVDVCSAWHLSGQLGTAGLASMLLINDTHVTCELFLVAGVAATMDGHSHGNKLVSTNGLNFFSFELSRPLVNGGDKMNIMLVFAALILIYFILLICSWLWDYHDQAIFEANITSKIATDKESAPPSLPFGLNKSVVALGRIFLLPRPAEADATGQVARSVDYRMLKMLFCDHLEMATCPFAGRFRFLIRSDHLLLGLFNKKVVDHLTRPRRVTCLFAVISINITANLLIISNSGNSSWNNFDFIQRISVGIICSVLTFPVGQAFAYLFESVDSLTTCRMRCRRRVKRVQESAVLSCASRLLDNDAVPSGYSSDQQKNSTIDRLYEPKRSSVLDAGSSAVLSLHAKVLPCPPPTPKYAPVFKRHSAASGLLCPAPAMASTEMTESGSSTASAAATPRPPSIKIHPPPPPPVNSIGFKRKKSLQQSCGDSTTEEIQQADFGKEMVRVKVFPTVPAPESELSLFSVQLHGLGTRSKEEVILLRKKFSYVSSNVSCDRPGLGQVKQGPQMTDSVFKATNKIKELQAYVSPHRGCFISKFNDPVLDKACLVSKPFRHVVQGVVSNEDQLYPQSESLTVPSPENFGFAGSSNPPPDYSSLEEGPAALNPPLVRDFSAYCAESKLNAGGKAIVSPDGPRIGPNIPGGRSLNTSRAWKSGSRPVKLQRELLRGSHGTHTSRPSPDGPWLQPLTSNSNAPGDYLPRRLFGFPLDWASGIPRSAPQLGAQNSSRRSRVMIGLGHGLLPPIQEIEDLDMPNLGTVNTAYPDSLTNCPKSSVSYCKSQPLYSPKIVVFGYLLTFLWTALCLWATLDSVSSSCSSLGGFWGQASIIGVIHEILVHQCLRVAATAAAIGAALQKNLHLGKKRN